MKLEDWLKANHVTQADFAAAVGVDQATISRLIPAEGKRQRRRPSFDLVEKIMRATDGAVTANDFMTDALGEPPPADPDHATHQPPRAA